MHKLNLSISVHIACCCQDDWIYKFVRTDFIAVKLLPVSQELVVLNRDILIISFRDKTVTIKGENFGLLGELVQKGLNGTDKPLTEPWSEFNSSRRV